MYGNLKDLHDERTQSFIEARGTYACSHARTAVYITISLTEISKCTIMRIISAGSHKKVNAVNCNDQSPQEVVLNNLSP